MATTDIHPITQTVDLSIAYIMKDKKESILRDDVADSIRYIVNDETEEVTYTTLTSTLNCTNLQNPAEDFRAWIHKFGQREVLYGNSKTKDGKPILAWHLIQSFDGEEVDPITANEIGRKLAEEIFGDFPVIICTHTNTNNIHNHIEFCAWNMDGRKWNQCNSNYQRIRECSDRLCDEYGLSVLEATRKQKLIRWTDKKGTQRYFEPTERKKELIRKRSLGEFSSDDVNSYRNTLSYEISETKRLTNAEMVKCAIDDLLPCAVSFEHLLFMLREMGFTVKDKKKNGEWLSYITFTAPTASKGVRDYMIDKGRGYYTRESLAAIIDGQNAEHTRNGKNSSNGYIPHYGEYVYGEVDVQNINEDYRADVNGDRNIQIVPRGEVEKVIIREVKKLDRELYGLYDTSKLERLITAQKEERKLNGQLQEREEVLVRQIRESFESLRFIERKQIYSYTQICESIRGLKKQYASCLSEIQKGEEMVSQLEEAKKAPHVLVKANRRMEDGAYDISYLLEKYPEDEKIVKSCLGIINKYNIFDKEGLDALEAKIQKHRRQIENSKICLDVLLDELAVYDKCAVTLARIDHDRNNKKVVKKFLSETNLEQKRVEKNKEKQKEYER